MSQKMSVVVGEPIAQGATPKDYKRANRLASAKKIGRFALSKGADLAVQFGSGLISNYFNTLAENRADARTRAFTRDQFKLMAEGRRSAGLNPYGDATAPGQVAALSTESAMPEARSLNELLAIEQFGLEKIAVEAKANRDNAEAERIRGQEKRDITMFPGVQKLQDLQITYKGLENEIKAVEALYAPDAVSLSVEHQAQVVANLVKQLDVKDAEIAERRSIVQLNASQIALNETAKALNIANTDLANVRVDEVLQNISLMSAQEFQAYAGGNLSLKEADVAVQKAKNLYREYKWMPVDKIGGAISNLAEGFLDVTKGITNITTLGASSAAEKLIELSKPSFDVGTIQLDPTKLHL